MTQRDDSEIASIRESAERLLQNPETPDDIARANLMLGCACEKESNFDMAVECYSKAITAEPRGPRIRYFANNNLGYSLVKLGRFDEAEGFCKAAIRINPGQYNAHKNLGLVFQGQEHWLDAAICFAQASHLCPDDPRARHLLEGLISARPDLISGSEELRLALNSLAPITDTPS
jgi:tetratricopeptide (TPR) repeat protein